MAIWEHLFLTGEFRARVDLLSGLNLEQVTLRPAGASHSIYDELWHAATWQRTSPRQDRRVAADGRRVAAEGSDRGIVAAGGGLNERINRNLSVGL